MLGHRDAAALDRAAPFRDLGLDSLGMTELSDRLTGALNTELTTATLFSYPSAEALVGHLRGDHARGAAGEPAAAAVVTAAVRAGSADPVVIVGMGCRYPGGVVSPDDLWRVVVDGLDVTGDFPADRGWDLEGLFDPDPERVGTTYTRRGGFLYGAGEFD
ncbi:acyl carrier protein, partial [Frankia sp. AvcI1]|uniref:acyl carrier protein n=1 Tax=Frankia sp. AvcI1 TaxID=573496 RepID=UPI001F18908C